MQIERRTKSCDSVRRVSPLKTDTFLFYALFRENLIQELKFCQCLDQVVKTGGHTSTTVSRSSVGNI